MAQDQIAASNDDPVSNIVVPAAKFGALCGIGGFLFGGTSGILRGAPPFLFATASAVQTFALGTVFSGTRHGVIHAWTTSDKPLTANDLTKASAVAGGISGGVIGLLTRGRSNVVPGIIMFTLFGAAGQYFHNRWTSSEERETSNSSFWVRLSQKNWSPVRIMSNDEYAKMLQEKMLRIDAEIAILDDKIAALKEQQNQKGSQDVTRTTTES